MSKGATIVRWTGRGRIEDLVTSIAHMSKDRKVKVSVNRAGDSVIVSSSYPAGVADLLKHLPGARWIAVGFKAQTPEAQREAAVTLAERYLRPGKRFRVDAEVAGDAGPQSDYAGAAGFAILDAVEGVRMDEKSPDLIFKVARDGREGVIGVESSRGAGGVPSGKDKAMCLVSGGKHSAVVAWMAVLMGYRTELLHVKVDDVSERSVARLYSELSYRADPTVLSLRVLEGGDVPDTLAALVGKSAVPVFGGFHRGTGRRGGSPLRVNSPLYLLPEEEFERQYSDLHLKSDARSQSWRRTGRIGTISKMFGGKSSDVNGVLDGFY